MRRGQFLFAVLFLAALAFARPADAVTVTVQITGTWDSVLDSAGVTDGSLVVGGAFVATLVFDDATPPFGEDPEDPDPDPSTASYLLPAASTDLTIESGSYTFSLLATSTILMGITDNVDGEDKLGWLAENFSTIELAEGASTGYGYMNPVLSDSRETAHSSDDLNALPWSIDAYDAPGMYFIIEVLGQGQGECVTPNGQVHCIELSGTITGLLPEPAGLALIGLALLALAGARRLR